MKFLRNRTVLGVVCIAIALVICFVITPMFNASASHTTEIARIKKDVKVGQEITAKDIETVEVGSYNLPAEVLKKQDDVIGKYVASEMLKGEYILSTKISDTPASENAYLYSLTGEKRAISVSIKSFAGGLSGKLISGDIVSIIAVDYQEKGETVVPEELQYVEVIAATDKSGNDEGEVIITPDGEEKADLPATITLLVTPVQADILAYLEAEGKIHVALVYRGTPENAKKFIDAQEKLLGELAEMKEKEKEQETVTVPAVEINEDIEDLPEQPEAEDEVSETAETSTPALVPVIIENEPEETAESSEEEAAGETSVETEETADAETV